MLLITIMHEGPRRQPLSWRYYERLIEDDASGEDARDVRERSCEAQVDRFVCFSRQVMRTERVMDCCALRIYRRDFGARDRLAALSIWSRSRG